MKDKRKAEEDRADYFRASVGAMLIDNLGRILVLKRTDTAGRGWQMPQGGIRPGENPEAALARELREETGLAPGDVTVLA
ncbi:MAG: NUDIX domain-containing protein, partial [Desulfobacteraceae bacterium]